MPIASADLLLKYSINTGPGNSTTQPNPNDSIGGFMSATAMATSLHGLFDPVTGDENAAQAVDYRCVFIHNAHASLTLQNPKLWLSADTAGGANLAIAMDGTGVVSATSASAQAERIANEATAPTGETFTSPTSKAAGIALPSIPAGSCVGIWVRRTATNSAALSNDGGSLRIEGDTAA